MKKLLFFISLLPLFSIAQTQIQGILLDIKTKQALTFATITTSSNFGTLTDIDGKFSIKAQKAITQISISYIGYETLLFPIAKNEKFLKMKSI